MKSLSVGELKARLSVHLRSVQSGEQVLVTDRGRPIARIVPYLPDPMASDDLQALVAAGLVRPPSARLSLGFFDDMAPTDPDARLRSALAQEREEGQ